VCQFSAVTDGPTATVHIVTKAGKILDTSVPVGSYNYCGRDIGYLRVNLSTLAVEEARTISACSM
jgi:hypothetical protein